MTTLSQLALRPSGVVVAKPEDFSPSWENRPRHEVAIGLRPISPQDAVDARRLAAETAWKEHPQEVDQDLRVEAYNDALMRFVLARGTCDPNDARARLALWSGVEDSIVFVALTREGAKRLYDAHERAELSARVDVPEATDEDVARLPEAFARAVRHPAEAARLRRLMGYVLDVLEGRA